MGNLWQIAVVIVLAAILLPAANMAYDDASTATTTTENITVQHGETTAVSQDAAVYDETVTITDGNETLQEGSDYDWQASFGAVQWYENGSVADGEEVEIQYTYHEADDTTDGIATIIGSVGWLVWALVFLTVIATLIAWLGFGEGGGW